MVIKAVRQVGEVTEVELEYVGERSKTISLDQKDLREFDNSHYIKIEDFIKHKHGTDY